MKGRQLLDWRVAIAVSSSSWPHGHHRRSFPCADAHVAENSKDIRAELRMRESVDGRRQGRLPQHLTVNVDWAELADEADDGVRRPGRQKKQGLRQQTERRPQFCPPTVFYK